MFCFKKTKVEEKKGPASCKEAEARIVVRYDVGYDNYLFIRGNGPGLSWEKGVKLKNIGPDEWVWETGCSSCNCEFKVLINDVQYETGENHHLYDGVVFHYTPHF